MNVKRIINLRYFKNFLQAKVKSNLSSFKNNCISFSSPTSPPTHENKKNKRLSPCSSVKTYELKFKDSDTCWGEPISVGERLLPCWIVDRLMWLLVAVDECKDDAVDMCDPYGMESSPMPLGLKKRAWWERALTDDKGVEECAGYWSWTTCSPIGGSWLRRWASMIWEADT